MEQLPTLFGYIGQKAKELFMKLNEFILTQDDIIIKSYKKSINIIKHILNKFLIINPIFL